MRHFKRKRAGARARHHFGTSLIRGLPARRWLVARPGIGGSPGDSRQNDLRERANRTLQKPRRADYGGGASKAARFPRRAVPARSVSLLPVKPLHGVRVPFVSVRGKSADKSLGWYFSCERAAATTATPSSARLPPSRARPILYAHAAQITRTLSRTAGSGQ